MDHRQQVAALRDRIAALQSERATIAQQARTRADVRAEIERTIAQWQERGAATLAREVQRAALGAAPELLTAHGAGPAAGGVAHVRLDLGPLLVSVLGAGAMRKALLATLDAVPEGLDAAARAGRLAAIDADLDTTEREEERLICEAELLGDEIERRADARPEILLALTGEE